MHLQIRRNTLISLLAILTVWELGLPSLVLIEGQGFHLGAVALAQTSDAHKAEADRLLEQGIEQFKTSQFQAALESWQQALKIYQEIGDRSGEGVTLNNIGEVYRSLGQYPKPWISINNLWWVVIHSNGNLIS